MCVSVLTPDDRKTSRKTPNNTIRKKKTPSSWALSSSVWAYNESKDKIRIRSQQGERSIEAVENRNCDMDPVTIWWLR